VKAEKGHAEGKAVRELAGLAGQRLCGRKPKCRCPRRW
jgi:hypothetical protein